MIRAVFPGTFDPIHYGHVDIARRAALLFDEVVVAVFDKPQKNLVFSPEERIDLVKRSFVDDPKIRVVGYRTLTVNFCHEIGAKVIVRGLRVFSDFEFEFRMALANNRLAPDIELVALITNDEHTFLSSSTVREISALGGDVSTMVPPHVFTALRKRFQDLGENQQVTVTSLRD